MVGPKPQDPSQTSISPGQLAQQIEEILSVAADDPSAEAAQLEAAHAVLSDALQQN